MDSFFISTDKNLLNPEVIHGFLSQSYWAKGIQMSSILKRIENSLCFGVYDADKNQMGFARVITDLESFAYLADVFILQEHQGKGLSRALMQYIVDYPDLKNLRRFMLATQDAHYLYEKFDFKPISRIENWMEKINLDAYSKNQN